MTFKPEDFRLPIQDFLDQASRVLIAEQIKMGTSFMIPFAADGIRVYRGDGELIGYFGRRCICCGGGGVNHDME